MNYLSIEKTSVANGVGIRTVLWVSGCSLHCKGCHNPESWDFNAGKPFDKNAMKELMNCLSKPYINGLTISGGHPLENNNLSTVFSIISNVKAFEPTKDIWLYTGLNLEYNDFVFSNPKNRYDMFKYNVLTYCDVVVDGEFREELRDTTLAFRGSSNQRLIDVKKTIKNKSIVLYTR